MKRVPFKWTDFGLMIVGGGVAAVIYVLVSGDYEAQGPYLGTAIFAGVSLGTYPLVKRMHERDQAEKAAEVAEAPVETDTPA